jgi:hypothetical protein
MDSTRNAVKAPLHHWINIAAGRVCQVCSLTQAADELDDSVPCTPHSTQVAVRTVESADAEAQPERPA